jgi:hypothetical protein
MARDNQASAPASAAADKTPKPRDRWEKADILLKGLLPVAVAGVGYFGTSYLEQRQAEDSRRQFYTDLLARREEADSNLRKEMFRYVIDNFLGKELGDPRKRLVGLEMLAVNFHDSFDLSPLFKEAHAGLLQAADKPALRLLRDDLEKLGRDIGDRQVASLADLDHRWDFEVSEIQDLQSGVTVSQTLLSSELKPLSPVAKDAPPLTLIITATAVDTVKRALRLYVVVRRQDAPDAVVERELWVSFFDFPALNSLRLPNRERVAVVLRHFNASNIQLMAVHFPESRASLKEKPYFDDLVNDLKHRADR